MGEETLNVSSSFSFNLTEEVDQGIEEDRKIAPLFIPEYVLCHAFNSSSLPLCAGTNSTSEVCNSNSF